MNLPLRVEHDFKGGRKLSALIPAPLSREAGQKVIPNRELYGYGYNAYFIPKQQEQLEKEFEAAGVNIVRALSNTDYNNNEFVIEDIDGRWIAFGIKEYKS
jgi:hypothetical protein